MHGSNWYKFAQPSVGKSDAFVFFGASGDLAYKQTFPALVALARRGKLDMPIIGVAKDRWSTERLLDRAEESIRENGEMDPKGFGILKKNMRYVGGDIEGEDLYRKIRGEISGAKSPFFYLEIPPSLFETTVRHLKGSGCAAGGRVAVEKPFGSDSKSARALDRTLHRVFGEESIFRIDHFLGKKRVQELIPFRFEMGMDDDVWSSRNIEHIQIGMIEDFGIKGRGEFYDENGCIRDVFQNHLMQLVGIVGMEPFGRSNPENFRREKARLFSRVRALGPKDVVRGQFEGYDAEEGVEKGSQVETYAAVRLSIDNRRWRGVPWFIRSGKMLPMTSTEILVKFKRPVDIPLPENGRMDGDTLRLQLEGEVDNMLTYERLFGYAMEGDPTFFSRQDEVEEQWRVFDGVLGEEVPCLKYKPKTWGPETDNKNVIPPGGWVEPLPVEER